MIAQISPDAVQVPENALWILAGWILSTLLVGWSGYRWGLKSQISAKKLEVKIAMLPLLEKFIIQANGDDWYGLRPDSIGQLLDPVVKLKSLIPWRKRRLLNKAWDAFSKTTPEEFHIPQHTEGDNQRQKMRQTFLERLNSLKAVVSDY